MVVSIVPKNELMFFLSKTNQMSLAIMFKYKDVEIQRVFFFKENDGKSPIFITVFNRHAVNLKGEMLHRGKHFLGKINFNKIIEISI